MNLSSIQALTFDIFGTVVDWRTPIIREGSRLSKSKGIQVDWPRFADAWRGGYIPSMNRVRKGEVPWMNLDAIHRMLLDQLLIDFNIIQLSEAEKDHFSRVWHRLDPWPDSIEGVARLRKRFLVAALSNGNMALLTRLSKHVGLTWDCILSCELVKHYKPDKEVYQMAADYLALKPEQVLMVAAHAMDLRGASAVGFRTAFVQRPLETDALAKPVPDSGVSFDIIARDFDDLAEQLME